MTMTTADFMFDPPDSDTAPASLPDAIQVLDEVETLDQIDHVQERLRVLPASSGDRRAQALAERLIHLRQHAINLKNEPPTVFDVTPEEAERLNAAHHELAQDDREQTEDNRALMERRMSSDLHDERAQARRLRREARRT